MSENPYAPPASDLVAPTERGNIGGSGDFDIEIAISEAWAHTKANFGLLVGAGLLFTLTAFFSAITLIGYFILVPVLLWGGAKLLLNVADGKGAIGDLFAGFSCYGRSLGRTLLFLLIMVAITLLSESGFLVGTVIDSEVMIGVGYLIYMVLAVTVIMPLYFALFYIVDQDQGAVDALNAAWSAFSGKRIKLLGILIVSTSIAFAGLLVFIVGLFFTVPMSYLIMVSVYRQMAGRPQEAAA